MPDREKFILPLHSGDTRTPTTGTLRSLSRRQLLGGLGLVSAAAAGLLVRPPAFSDAAPLVRAGQQIDWEDGMQIHVSSDAIFHIEESAGERRLYLSNGEATTVTKPPAGLHGALQPQLVVMTPGARLSPMGGVCTVAHRADRSVLDVFAGTVFVRAAVADPGSDKAGDTVRAGQAWRTA